MQPLDYCRQKAAESRSSFLAAFRFLPQRRQDAMTVLYAFCRELDDVVDDCTDMQVAQTTLNWWRADLAKVFDGGAPEHPVCRAQQLRSTARLELHRAFQALHGDLTGGLVLAHALAGGQHHAHDFELARLEDGAGGGLCQPVTQRKDTDDLARRGVGKCHGGVSCSAG